MENTGQDFDNKISNDAESGNRECVFLSGTPIVIGRGLQHDLAFFQQTGGREFFEKDISDAAADKSTGNKRGNIEQPREPFLSP